VAIQGHDIAARLLNWLTSDRGIMISITRRSVLGIPAGLVAVRYAAAQAVLPEAVSYKPFGSAPAVQLRPYVGRNVALLLNPNRATEQIVAERVVSAIDRAWDWYRDLFGRLPASNRTYAGKSTVAEVEASCGAGCGLIGNTGIEISTPTMNRLLIEAAQDRYNQAVFYELGRNFFFFTDQLRAMAPFANGGVFTTGFAHVHRFYAMDAAGLTGAPWDDKLDFDGFRYFILVELLDLYLADKSLTWENTLAVDKVPKNPHDWISGAHLAAAFFHRIRRDHGYAGYRRFWQLMATAPKSSSPRDAAARFVQVARAATGQDYRDLMRDSTLPLA
jgi:serralysin